MNFNGNVFRFTYFFMSEFSCGSTSGFGFSKLFVSDLSCGFGSGFGFFRFSDSSSGFSFGLGFGFVMPFVVVVVVAEAVLQHTIALGVTGQTVVCEGAADLGCNFILNQTTGSGSGRSGVFVIAVGLVVSRRGSTSTSIFTAIIDFFNLV